MPPTHSNTGTESTADTRAKAGTAGPDTGRNGDRDSDDTLDLALPAELLGPCPEGLEGHESAEFVVDAAAGPESRHSPRTLLHLHDLLDDVAEWGPVNTLRGAFQLVPVALRRDLPIITRWMNDPAVAEFWQLSGPPEATEKHLREQLDGDGRSVPCLGILDGTPVSYWEIYRADLDPVARYYPVRPHDTGVHLLIGRVADRGRGLGTELLRATADLVLEHRPACTRVIAEPDLRNTPSVAAFLAAGFRFAAEIELPDKRAALVVRDRALRHLL